MAGLPPLDAVVEALASPLGAIAFVPLYALGETIANPTTIRTLSPEKKPVPPTR